jgi:hypothetical protein
MYLNDFIVTVSNASGHQTKRRRCEMSRRFAVICRVQKLFFCLHTTAFGVKNGVVE